MVSTLNDLARARAATLWAVLASMLALGACSGAGDDEGPEQPLDEAGAGAAGRAGSGDARSGRGGAAATEAGTGTMGTGDAGSGGDDVDAGSVPGSAGSDGGGSGAGGSGAGGSGEPGGDGLCTGDGACEEAVELAPGNHVQGDIDYGELPPAGGPHNPCWDDYGVHDDLLPPENWVHNLEHGAVVFLHDCPEGCDAEVAMLESFVGERSWGILTRLPGLTTRFAVVAWGYRLMTDELDLDAFAAFYDAHADHAPESVSSGKPAGCP